MYTPFLFLPFTCARKLFAIFFFFLILLGAFQCDAKFDIFFPFSPFSFYLSCIFLKFYLFIITKSFSLKDQNIWPWPWYFCAIAIFLVMYNKLPKLLSVHIIYYSSYFLRSWIYQVPNLIFLKKIIFLVDIVREFCFFFNQWMFAILIFTKLMKECRSRFSWNQM